MPHRQEPKPEPQRREEHDPERDVMMKAAAHLEHHRREREELRAQLAAAQDLFKEYQLAMQVALDGRDARIADCELALETERQRVVIYQQERDQAVADRHKAESDRRVIEQLYGNLFGMLERFRLPPAEMKRKGNGNGKPVAPSEVRAAVS
jgi:hypothetical protein